jgi:hypothetical protein
MQKNIVSELIRGLFSGAFPVLSGLVSGTTKQGFTY